MYRKRWKDVFNRIVPISRLVNFAGSSNQNKTLIPTRNNFTWLSLLKVQIQWFASNNKARLKFSAKLLMRFILIKWKCLTRFVTFRTNGICLNEGFVQRVARGNLLPVETESLQRVKQQRCHSRNLYCSVAYPSK